MSGVRVLGTARLVDDVRQHGQDTIRGVAIFNVPGLIFAAMAAQNPMFPNGLSRVAAVKERAAKGSLPLVVVLAVREDAVLMFPATNLGHITAGPLAEWRRGEFKAATRSHPFVTRLVVVFRDGSSRIELETKTFLFGPNRDDKRVAWMIADMSDRTGTVPPHTP